MSLLASANDVQQGGASEKATEAAIIAAGGGYGYDHQKTRAALKAAHHPMLGEDRSVSLRAVLDALRAELDGDEFDQVERGIRSAIATISEQFGVGS